MSVPTGNVSGSGDTNGSSGNQAALEQRFQKLYEAMMEKKAKFKEATEPFKTDNENASKG